MNKHKRVKDFTGYEPEFEEFFQTVKLKPNHSNLIRAFMKLANGEVYLELSFPELGIAMFGDDPLVKKKHTRRATSTFKSLQKWQEENKLELIRQTETGNRTLGTDGKFAFSKSKYEFILLRELSAPWGDASDEPVNVLEGVLERIKQKYKPLEKSKPYPLGVELKRVKNTVFTKFRRVFELACEDDLNPVTECHEVIKKCWKVVNEMAAEREEHQDADAFIEDFEGLLHRSQQANNEAYSN